MKRAIVIVLVVIFFVPHGVCLAFEASPADIYMGEGVHSYTLGNFDDALYQFNKVLLVEPYNAKAQEYIGNIKQQYSTVTRSEVVAQSLDEAESALRRVSSQYGSKKPSLSRPPDVLPSFSSSVKKGVGEKNQADDIAVTGDIQVAAGVRSPGKVVWKEANGDLNERNYRILWSPTRANTCDPAVYDRLHVNIDTRNLEGIAPSDIGAHANITIDPWSFTGKTEKFTVDGAGGDRAEFELKYWSNTSKTINEIVNTLDNGDALALPEIKVRGNQANTTIASSRTNSFVIPSQKVTIQFMPLREFWVESKGGPLHWRLFPIAYQDQAFTTDDPLGLSNKHTWWEESPWLAEWKSGNLNAGALPVDFTKGKWDDTLAFFTRDSDGLRLSSLRGFSAGYKGVDGSFDATVASPKNLWADYGYFETVAAAARLKYDLSYNLGLGTTYTGHFGYWDKKLDGLDNVLSFDAKYEPTLGAKLLGQVAFNDAYSDRSNETYESRRNGNAYLISLINRFPAEEIYTGDYFSIKKAEGERAFLKSRLVLARMEEDFNPTLSSYRQTRDDEFWSRHISFRKHPLYLYTGLTKPMQFDDIKTFAIGDGIDTGRDVVGLRLEGALSVFDRDLEALADVRNVHRADSGSFMENVSRLELTYPFTDKLTTKFLGVRQDMAKTTAGVDPFVFDPVLNKPYLNNSIAEGRDPSLATTSLGLDYKLTPIFSFNSVWEHTNDAMAATDNFPRGLFGDSSFTTYREDGKVYRETIPFLYSQQFFDLPPYSYFDIYKFGFSVTPVQQLEFYLDFAYNQNKKAGQIDDNMNHYGLEIAYEPSKKVSLFFKYALSRWIDLVELNATGIEEFGWHNNFFFQTRYRVDDVSELLFDYGVGGITPLGTSISDPFGGALAVLDTQHIVRLYYRRSF